MEKRVGPKVTVTESPTETGMQSTICMEGELDAATIAGFRDVAFGAIGARPERLLLDLSAVPFVDTAALSGLITVARVATRLHIPIALRPAPQLRRVFTITGLTQILPIDEPDEETQ